MMVMVFNITKVKLDKIKRKKQIFHFFAEAMEPWI